MMDSLNYNSRRRRCSRQVANWMPMALSLQCRVRPVTVIKVPEPAQNTFSDIGGLRQLSNEKISFGTRIIWLIIILGATIISIFQCAECISYYLSDPSRIRVEYIQNNTIKLPAVTFCPDTHFPSLNSDIIKKRFGNATNKDVFSWLEKRNISLSEVWTLAKRDMNISLINHEHLEDSSVMQKLINVTEVYTPVGTCHQVKFNADLKQLNGRPLFVLQLEEEVSGKTVHLTVPEECELDKYFYHIKGFPVPTTVSMTFVVSVIESILRNTSKKPCTSNENVSNCLSHCFENILTQNATKKLCRLPFLRHFNETSPCNSKLESEEMIKTIKAVTNQFNPEQCNCGKKCRQVLYVVDYVHEIYDYFLAFKVNVADGRVTTLKEEAAYSIYDAVSDFGGCLALWLGICFLQVLEVGTSSISKVLSKLMGTESQPKPSCVKGKMFRIVVIRDVGLNTEAIPTVNLPGFSNVTKHESSCWIRLIWLTVSVVALLLCITQCIERTVLYFSDSSTVNVYYTSDMSVPFPSIMVCPNRSDELIKTLSANLIQEKLGKPHNFTEVLQLISKGELTADDAWNMSGFSLNYADNIASANNGWISSEVPTVWGNCLTFKPKKNFNYMRGQISQTLNVFADNEPGIILIATYPNEELAFVKYLLLNEFVQREHADFGFFNILTAFRLTKISYRNTHQKPCIHREQVVSCLVDCFEKKTALKIPLGYCRLPFMNTAAPACLTVAAMADVLSATFSTIAAFNTEDCSCSRSCRELVYTTEYVKSMASFEDDTYVQMVIWKNEMMVMEEVRAYSGFALFSDLGASLGLFSGICIMNLYEIMESLIFKLFTFLDSRFWCKTAKNRLGPHIFHNRIIVLETCTKGTISKRQNVDISHANSIQNKSHFWNRVLRSLISAGLFCSCIFLMAERTQHYISKPTASVTNYSRNRTITFPVMVICTEIDHSLYGEQGDSVAFLDSWNTSAFQPENIIMKINQKRIESKINSTKINTAAGICLMITPENPVKYVGYETAVEVSVHFSSEKSAWMAAFSAEKLPLLKYLRPQDCYTADGARPFFVNAYLKLTELVHSNTHKRPCENGQAAASCLVNCIERKINNKHGWKCRLPFMQESKTLQLCQTLEEYKEVKIATLSVLENFNNTDCNCARECRATIYSVDELEFFSLETQIITFTVYIRENFFPIIIEEIAYSFSKLLLDFGGFLGLFFGFGVIQLLEMLASTATQITKIKLKE